MRQTTRTTFMMCIIAVMFITLPFAITGSANNYGQMTSVGQAVMHYPPKEYLQKQQTQTAKIGIPNDLSILRGNPQRTGVFANGGTPPLKSEVWRKWQDNAIESPPIMAGDLVVFS